jgi:hypothetical protein
MRTRGGDCSAAKNRDSFCFQEVAQVRLVLLKFDDLASLPSMAITSSSANCP